MEGQIDPNLFRSVSVTKTLLESHISKPLLTEKYLTRPPFRFLLEIVNNVIQETKFMSNIFPSNEIKYENVSTAGDKREILQKVINAIENETGEKCGVRISKILSGKEPEKTNEMLQLLAKSISSFSNKQKTTENDTPENATRVEREGKRKSSVKQADKKNLLPKTEDEKKEKNKRNDRGTAAAAASQLAKRSSNAAMAQNVKARMSDSKITQKPAVGRKSMPTSKGTTNALPVKEIKSKSGSPSVLPSSLPSKGSSVSLTKPVLRPTLATPSSVTSSKASITSELQSKGNPKSESKNAKESVTATSIALPAETLAQLPLQRPVSRTKYRQKVEAEDDIVTDIFRASSPLPDRQELLSPPHPGSIAQTPPQCERAEEPDEGDNVPIVEETTKMNGVVGYDIRSGRSSSSEEVASDTMNQKILEWRATSAEGGNESTDPSLGLYKQFQASGWTTDNSDAVSKDGTSLNVVSHSPESCIVESESCTNVIKKNAAISIATPFYSKPVTHEEMELKVPEMPVGLLTDILSDNEDDDPFLVQEKIECDNDMALKRLKHGELLMGVDDHRTSSGRSYLAQENRGLLVNQIIETQKELERWSSNHSQFQESAEVETREKAAMREVYLKQIENLKGAIQKMSKCANPIANMIQRTQDDACLMEIEFDKLRKEDERLQKKLNETKGQTSKMLLPLTEELTQLDSRIQKVEDAIVQAKHRLSLIDTEYQDMFIVQLANTPTEDETPELQTFADPILQFQEEETPIENKSLQCVFQRAISMHQGVTLSTDETKHMLWQAGDNCSTAPYLMRHDGMLRNRSVFGISNMLVSRNSSAVSLRVKKVEPVKIDPANKPSWWD